MDREYLDAPASALRGVARDCACLRACGRSGFGTLSGFGTNRQYVRRVNCQIREKRVYWNHHLRRDGSLTVYAELGGV